MIILMKEIITNIVISLNAIINDYLMFYEKAV